MSENVVVNGVTMTEEERLNELKRLKSSYVMYERAKKEMVDKRTNLTDQYGNNKYTPSSVDSTMEIMNNMQEDIISQYQLLGGNIEDLENVDATYQNDNTSTEKDVEKSPKDINIGNGVMEYLEKLNEKEIQNKSEISMTKPISTFDANKVKEQFDMIPLPSKGECYVNKLDKLPISYLTAYDENIIVSPNLYRDGTLIDVLLKNKILNPSVDPKELLPGDRDAIILWLRATGYGNEFPVTVTDNETGKEFTTNIDLSQINYKEFNLKGDENGWFEYTLPYSKDVIKFSFLTYGEVEELTKIDKAEDISAKREDLKDMCERINNYQKDSLSKTFPKKFAKRIDEATKTLEEWYDMIEVEEKTRISHTLTNRLSKMIKSINGITDRTFINEYIVKMSIRDSSAFRKFLLENEPGLDFNIDVERPKSLGGGSMSTFLTLDQFVFLNIA